MSEQGLHRPYRCSHTIEHRCVAVHTVQETRDCQALGMDEWILRERLQEEAAQPAMTEWTQLNRQNYNFELTGYVPWGTGGQKLLMVSPKVSSKHVYRGSV